MIEDTFQKLKSNLELTPTFAEIVSQRHKAVRSVIENNSSDIQSTRLIGSLSRQTRIQPRPVDEFDIDVLVVLGVFDRWVPPETSISTETAMREVHSAVVSADRYVKLNPEQDHPTVTFDYANNIKVELVPAYLDNIALSPNGAPRPRGRAYWIPARNGTWELADYAYDAEYISIVNKDCSGLLIPTIKMLKAAKRWHFPSMKSWHLELIAADLVPKMLQEYQQHGYAATYPQLVADFLYRLDGQLAQTRPRSAEIPAQASNDPRLRP
jgi:SMODS domain-containing protein